MPLVLTPLNITVIRLTHDGIPVKSIEVPEVDAWAVLEVKMLLAKVTFCEASIVSAVVPAVCNCNIPEASPELTSPPPPALFAEIVEAIIYSS